MDEGHEDPWALLPSPSSLGLTAREQRVREREQRIAAHVRRHKDHGTQPPRRDRGLTREDIVATAIAIADTEGVEAISMRRIAKELKAGVMSLYWYVASKDELQDLMLERFEGELEVPEPSGDWRADMRAFARNTRAALLRHQWAIELRGFRPPSGPNDARNADRVLGAFDGLGLDAMTTVMMTMTIGTYVLGAVLREIKEIRLHQETEQVIATMTKEEISAISAEFAKRLLQSGDYPHIARFISEDVDPDSPDTRDERFEFGLECVLDGIAARIPPTAPAAPA